MREAGTKWIEATKIVMDRKEWEQRITKRIENLEKWECQQVNFSTGRKGGNKKFELTTASFQCNDCRKLCKEVGGLKRHIKRINTEARNFSKCNR